MIPHEIMLGSRYQRSEFTEKIQGSFKSAGASTLSDGVWSHIKVSNQPSDTVNRVRKKKAAHWAAFFGFRNR